MHNLQLTEDQEMVVDTVRKLVADVVAPKAQELDEHRTFVREWFDQLAELGVFGVSVREEKGGAGMGLLPYVASLEAVGNHSGSLARLWIEQAQSVAALEQCGSDRLDDAISGGSLMAFIGAEHGCRMVDGKLSGSAELVPGALGATAFVVATDGGSGPMLVLVSADVARRTELRPLGLQSAGCGRVRFDGCPATVLATGDDAARAIDRAAQVAWIGVAAAALGGGEGSIELARRHAGERIAFGKPLLVQQAVQRKLVECRRALAAARQLVWHAARLSDLGQNAVDAALQARIAAVDAMVLAADESIQIHGGFGYTVEYHVERHYRDGKTFEVLDGGSDKLHDRLAALQFA